MSLPAALTPGTVIGGHYIVGDLINSGGFGAVYRGVDTSEGHRPCAIKETYDVTPAARRQALMEASVLFTVRSKHLPEVYDALEANGRFYLVMQLVEGMNLLQLLRTRVHGVPVGEQEPQQQATGPCSEQEVLNWLLPIMDILQELHSRNPPIMHRDIKPGNIILTPQHTAVLVDFGLTKLYDPARSTQTLVKAVSEGFSPLEQYLGKTTPQSDVYSMAATMYLLLTNRLPLPSVSRSMRDNLMAPRLLNPSLSLKTERVLLKAMAVHAADRYQSMREFAQALRGSTFDAHADRTVISAPVPSSPSPVPSQQSGPYRPSFSPPPYQSRSYQPSFSPPPYQSGPYQAIAPQQGYQSGQYGYNSPAYSAYPQLPAGYQSGYQPPQSLPSSFGQGCLWGLLQGILGALLVLFLKKEADFYLAVYLGFLFYVIAGLRTTRRGGSSGRGGWAGFWAAITGAVIFVVSLSTGLAIMFAVRLQAINRDAPTIDPTRAANQAWRAVQPVWPNPFIMPRQELWVNIVALLGGGLLVAWLLGWFGGLLGKLFAPTAAGRGRPGAYP